MDLSVAMDRIAVRLIKAAASSPESIGKDKPRIAKDIFVYLLRIGFEIINHGFET
jgi:hypothetical protein